MKLPSVTKKFWIVLVAIAIMSTFLALYLFVYVKGKEAEVIGKNYRTLDRIGKNVHELYQNYKTATKRVTDLKTAHDSSDDALLRKQGIFKLGNDETTLDTIVLVSAKINDKMTKLGASAEDFLKRSNALSSGFSEFFLVRLFLPRKDSTGKEIKAIGGGIAFQTLRNEIHLDPSDTIFYEDHGIQSIPTRDIVVAGTTYKVFSHRIRFRPNEDWILCGATRLSDFNHATHAVESHALAFASLTVLLLVLGMPIIKLLVMNAIDRLRLINVWLAGFSIVAGTSVLLLLILGFNQSVGYKWAIDDKLGLLSHQIERRFTKELISMHDQLTLLNTYYGGLLAQNTNNIQTVPNFFSNDVKRHIRSKNTDEKFKPVTETLEVEWWTHHPFFYDVMWSNEVGDQQLAVSTHPLDTNYLYNLNGRSYYSNARDGLLWTLPDNCKGTRKFSMQSIRSWIDGKHAAGIGVQPTQVYGQGKIVTMVSKLHSVMHPLLPPGYGFCIVDDKGEAWFHSQTERNMQENFIEEMDRDTKLISAINGRMSVPFEAYYHGERHRVFVQPIDNLPFHIVTFYDLRYHTSPLILTLGISLLAYMVMFLLIGLQLLIHYASVFKPTKLKIKRFYLYWLRPRLTLGGSDQEVTTARERYIQAILALTSMALVQFGTLIIYHPVRSVELGIFFLVTPLYILPYLYVTFERESILRDQQKWPIKSVLLHPFVWLSAVLIILVNISLGRKVGYQDSVAVIQSLFILIFIFCFKYEQVRASVVHVPVKAQQHQLQHHRLYSVMIFLWLLNVSVLPIISFYEAGYEHESLMWAKYQQWETGRRQVIWDLTRPQVPTGIPFNASRIPDGNYILATGDFKPGKCPQTIGNNSKPPLYYMEFLVRPNLTGIVGPSRAVLENAAADKSWAWQYSDEGPTMHMLSDSGNPICYHFEKQTFNPFTSDTWILFVILIAGLLFLVYHCTLFTIRNIFGLGVVMDTQLIAEALREIESDEISASYKPRKELEPVKHMCIVGLPYSGKRRILDGVRQATQFDQTRVVCEVHTPTDWDKNITPLQGQVVLFLNFEYGVNDHRISTAKLRLIEQCIRKKHSVILSSTISATAIIDFYEHGSKRLAHDTSAESAKLRIEYKQAIRMWRSVLSGFVTYYQPLGTRGEAIQDPFTRAELQHGLYLPSLLHLLKHETTDSYSAQENLVLRVEELADTYYHSLWNSFSKAEKFLLYDLAKDRFVNLRNVNVIRQLLQKGVIVAGDSLQLMNKSFNNFILRVVDEDDEVRMQHELNSKGSWGLVSTVLTVMIIGIVTFIALAEQNLLNDINVTVGVIGSLLTLLTKFGGVFDGLKSKGSPTA